MLTKSFLLLWNLLQLFFWPNKKAMILVKCSHLKLQESPNIWQNASSSTCRVQTCLHGRCFRFIYCKSYIGPKTLWRIDPFQRVMVKLLKVLSFKILKSELSPPPRGPRTDAEISLNVTSPPLLCSPKLRFLTSAKPSESSVNVVLSKPGAANKPTEELEKDRNSGLWNLKLPLSELCMTPVNKGPFYSLQPRWEWRWLSGCR